MKETYIRHKGLDYPLTECRVFTDCISYLKCSDEDHDDWHEVIAMNGEWEYIEIDVIPTLTRDEQLEIERLELEKVLNRRKDFLAAHPELKKSYRNELWIQYCKDNPI